VHGRIKNNKNMRCFKIYAVIAFIIIIGVAIAFPFGAEGGIYELSLLVTPVLFAIFIAFSISERLSRIDKIRENDSIERSSLESLVSYIKAVSPENHEEVQRLVDEYLMATLDYNIEDYYKTRAYYEKISQKLYSIKDEKVSDFSVDILGKILEAREQTVTLISDSMSHFEWLIYCILGTSVLLPYIMTNTGAILNVGFIVLITSSVLLLLSFLDKLDTLEWKREIRIFAPYQKTFEAIGSMRYFPQSLMGSAKVKKIAGDSYRIGHFPSPYPNFEGKTVEVYKK
jgi:hypothetical protein